MKKTILFVLLLMFLVSCKTDENSLEDINKTNKVVLLKVDFLTNVFEGGKEIDFLESSSFTISSTYNAPGDFGDVQLYFNELNEKIFDGTIIWMGTGEVSYPTEFEEPNTFATISSNLPLPNESMFENVMYAEFAYYPETIVYSNIWNSIGNLEVVESYQNSNPNGKINLFLYTPSVGVGNPEEWDWYIILGN